MKPQRIILRTEDQRQRVAGLISELNLEKPWEVTIRRYQQKRSLSQNNLYWKWLNVVSSETGNDADDLHEFFKTKFVKPLLLEVAGETQEVRPSTTKLSTQDMTDYLNSVYRFVVSELGILLPIPEELGMR